MQEYLQEWEKLINELSEKELALIEWKNVYRIKEEEILNNTDFKALYGANNEKVRRNHVKNELADWDNIIIDLQLSIDYITRRISFLKGLVNYYTATGTPAMDTKYGEWKGVVSNG